MHRLIYVANYKLILMFKEYGKSFEILNKIDRWVIATGKCTLWL